MCCVIIIILISEKQTPTPTPRKRDNYKLFLILLHFQATCASILFACSLSLSLHRKALLLWRKIAPGARGWPHIHNKSGADIHHTLKFWISSFPDLSKGITAPGPHSCSSFRKQFKNRGKKQKTSCCFCLVIKNSRMAFIYETHG